MEKHRNKSKKRNAPLHHWLYSIIESGKCRGVVWHDKIMKTFRIPWCNQKKSGVKEEDLKIFRKYAESTGKYSEGIKPDYPKWKQNLKSALNKNPFIKRVEALDNPTGLQSYRVYKFIMNNMSDEGMKSVAADGVTVTAKRSTCLENVLEKGATMASIDSTSYSNQHRPVSATSSDLNVPLESGNIPDLPILLPADLAQNISVDQDHGITAKSITTDTLTSFHLSSQVHGMSNPNSLNDVNVSQTTTENIDRGRQSALPAQSQLDYEGGDDSQQPQMMVENKHFHPPSLAPCYASSCPSSNKVYPLFSFLTVVPRDQRSFQPSTLSYSDTMSDIECSDESMVSTISDIAGVENVCYTENESEGQQLPLEMSRQFSNTDSIREYMSHNNEHLPSHQMAIAETTDTTTCHRSQATDLVTVPFQSTVIKTHHQSITQANDLATIPSTTNHEGIASVPAAMSCHSTDIFAELEVYYGNKHVLSKEVTNCRLFHGLVNTKKQQALAKYTNTTQKVELPAVEDHEVEEKYMKAIQDLYKYFEDGIILSCEDKSIYAERWCRPRVFYSDGATKSIPLLRTDFKNPKNKQKIFDYAEFLESVKNHARNSACPMARDHVYITIGQNIQPNNNKPFQRVPIYVKVRHIEASKICSSILEAGQFDQINPMFSDFNSFDRVTQSFENMSVN